MMCDDCITDKSLCVDCKHNPIYAKVPKTSLYQAYKPTCPKGYKDCVYDPAYIKHMHPVWYKKSYGDLTPEEASKERCNVNDEYCYDDEDK